MPWSSHGGEYTCQTNVEKIWKPMGLKSCATEMPGCLLGRVLLDAHVINPL